MSDFKNLFENGINPVDSDTENNDVYFTNENFSNKIDDDKESSKDSGDISDKNRKSKKKKSSKTKGVRSTYIFFALVITISMAISVYAILCLNDVFGITKSKATVTVRYDEQINSNEEAIDLLYDNDLITCKYFCRLFAKLVTSVIKDSPLDPPYAPGVYYLNGKMGLEDMLVTMKGEPEHDETVRITFPEGYTTADIINKLVANEVCDRAALLSVIETTEFSYSLVSDLKPNEKVPYRLEGYLFPETYDFYVGQSASSALSTFLETTEKKITKEDRERAKELGFTMHEIIIIASIVQAEAGNDEQMKTIASVIENRLKDKTNYPSLGCQSTSDYINNKVAPSLSSTSAHTSEYYLKYYNTNNNSTVVGLPEGPICNPGRAAIEAALYPEKTDYYFFFHDTKGKLYPAKTYSEFKSKIKKYAPYLSY